MEPDNSMMNVMHFGSLGYHQGHFWSVCLVIRCIRTFTHLWNPINKPCVVAMELHHIRLEINGFRDVVHQTFLRGHSFTQTCPWGILIIKTKKEKRKEEKKKNTTCGICQWESWKQFPCGGKEESHQEFKYFYRKPENEEHCTRQILNVKYLFSLHH